MQLLKIFRKGSEHISESFLGIFGGILLMVVAFLGLSLSVSVSISSNETGLRVNDTTFIKWLLIFSMLG